LRGENTWNWLAELKADEATRGIPIMIASAVEDRGKGFARSVHLLHTRFLAGNRRDLIDAEFALNEGGGVGLDKGKPLRVGVQTTEKLYMDFKAEVRDPGGHSSQPKATNAIYKLAEALVRLGKHEFPMALNDTTRAFMQRAAAFEEPQIATLAIQIQQTQRAHGPHNRIFLPAIKQP